MTAQSPGSGPGVVIVGGGQAGLQTAVSLRERGFAGPITMVAGEFAAPYQRPPLSKDFLEGAAAEADLVLRAPAFYAERGIDLLLGRVAAAIDRAGRTVSLEDGGILRYDRLVLALGSRARRLAVPGAEHPHVLSLRTLADAQRLRARLTTARRIVIVGAGFTGLEVAAAARAAGRDVTVVETLPRIMSRALSEHTAGHLLRLHGGHGVRILTGRRVAAIESAADGTLSGVRLGADASGGGELLPADLVLCAVGVEPVDELAAGAGLAVDGGIVVDSCLRTIDQRIFAVGDCVRFPSPYSDAPLRLESVQNAVDQGKCAAGNLCGEQAPYAAVPWFWTDQYEDKVQIAGVTAGHDRTEVDGDPASGSFGVYCFRGGRLVGVESVNRVAEHIRARRLLASGASDVRERLRESRVVPA
jgi:3-phenylpropionate/trans-cinnamate dioxygenase ferredoxin reductase subunit